MPESPIRKFFLPLLAVALWAPVIALVAAHIWGFVFVAQITAPSLLANSARNASRIAVPAHLSRSGWKFAVVGDLGRRYEIFLRALSEMKKNDIRFVIITGDSVYRKTAEQFEYLQLKIAASRFDRPIFAAIGNEDVPARDDYRLFRRYLAGDEENGAQGFFSFGKGYTERFAFTVSGGPPFQAIFIVFDNAFAAPSEEQVLWIEKLLQQYRDKARHVFLFSHQPIVQTSRSMQKVPSKEYLLPYERLEEPNADTGAPKLVYELIGIDPNSKSIPTLSFPETGAPEAGNNLPEPFWQNYRSFYDMLKKYEITAVFSGHLHGYRRYQIGGTVHFVTGGGGARLQYPGARYHYLEVEVRDNGIDVRPKILPGNIGFMTKLEQIMIAEIFLLCRNHPWLYAIAILWIAAGLWLRHVAKKQFKPNHVR